MCDIIPDSHNGKHTPVADTTRSETTPNTTESLWLWVGASLAAHAAWGAYPVLARYLQTVSNLPTFSILVLGNAIVLVVTLRYLLANTTLAIFKEPIIWLFGFIVAVRTTTNIASTRYTLSIYVQLVTQATPFLVILLSTLLYNEKLPRFTIPAVSLALIGALMMIGTDFAGATDDPTRQDWLGVTLTFISITALAYYMVLIRRSQKYAITGETLLLLQLIVIVVVSGIVSLLLREDWTQYLRIGPLDWTVFLAFTFIVFLGANFWQISAIQHIGAPFHSSLLAFRLVSALIFAWLLLGERLQSPVQIAGAVIVLVTITWYLWQQR